MKSIHRIIIACSFAALLPNLALAIAPVVDDTENFALLDDANDGNHASRSSERPAAYTESHSERAFAHESSSHSNPADSAELLDKLQGLQQELQELRGQLEVQAHQLKSLQEQQLNFYKDLDGRISNPAAKGKTALKAEANPLPTKEEALSFDLDKPELNKAQITTAAAPAIMVAKSKDSDSNPSNSNHMNPADEQVSYMAAYELIKNKDYEKAVRSMEAFVRQYPNSAYTANAQYWLGELYLVKKDYAQSIQHFDAVVQQFPSSSKAAASQLKIGYALAAAGRGNEAKQRLRLVIENYPDSNTAQLAKAKLEILGA